MISLLANGYPAPATFAVGTQYVLTFKVDGTQPIKALWTIKRRAGEPVQSIDTAIFIPDAAEPYYLHVQAISNSGLEETIFILQTTHNGQPGLKIAVRWSNPMPAAKKPFQGTILCSDQPRSLAWSLLFNNVPIRAGSGNILPVEVAQTGIYRAIITAVDKLGNTTIADSSIAVQAPFGLQSAITPIQPPGTLRYLGEVYSPIIEGDEVQAAYLPYELSSLTHTVKFLPGTTHYQIDLDPENNMVDDEVVVRTSHGNWTIKGPPTGLTSELLPYDYQHGQPFQPAPLDLSGRFTADVWKVHGMTSSPFRFRIRLKCYRVGDAIYRYIPCDWSAYYGGEGARQRRIVALITSVDALLDAEWPDHRLGSPNVETFTVPNQNVILGQLAPSGKPDRPLFHEDHFFTDQNTISRYEHANGILDDLTVSCAYGLISERPCYIDFSQPAKVRIIQKLKRLYGKLVLYVSGGGFTAGSVMNVRIYTGKGPVNLAVPIIADVYNPDFTRYARFGSLDIDIQDFEFDRVGVLMDFTLDETGANAESAGYAPLPQPADTSYYSSISSPAIKVDTACYRDPLLVPVFDGTFAGSAVPLNDCNRLDCGPVGLYCYTPMSGGTTINLPQPLGFPAPFIAYTDNQAECYYQPIFLNEITTDSPQPAVFSYSGTTGCGIGYRYDACGQAKSLAVIYPQSTVPHSTVAFGGTCWGFTGSIADLRPYQVVNVTDVAAVTSCTDVICTGSNPTGSSVLYEDQQSNAPVTVQFPHLERGIPAFGVASERFSVGYGLTPPGKLDYMVWDSSTVPLFTAKEDVTINIDITPHNIWRDLVVVRSGQRLHYKIVPGLPNVDLPLLAGDRVSLEFDNYFSQYRGKNGEVTWQRVICKPVLYDSAVLSFSDSQAITALGFTGLTNRQDYTFYGTLPANVETDLPNPDSLLTVQETGGKEMLLVQTEAISETHLPANWPLYNGKKLASPVTFRFYANRTIAGQHGEMDVWLEQDQSFPAYLKVSPFKVLTYGAYSYRKTSQFGDVARRGLRVVPGPDTIQFPNVYVASDGERISAVSSASSVTVQGKTFTDTGTVDAGISELVY